MAGFFDGEGCVRINKRIRNKYTEYSVFITIGQKDGATIDWIVQNFGGGSYFIKRDNSYVWTATNKIAYETLKKITPYLKYKKPQALLALSFSEERNQGKKTTLEEKERRELLIKKLSEEKKKFTKSIYCRTKDRFND